MKWTEKQEKAINEKGEILVAAAAGSGKTAVLVARNIKKIIEEKVDINKILAITFTNAAANEIKERILLSLYKELDKNEDDNIKKQIRLLPKANISTLHSFCLNLVKEHFFYLNLSSDVKVAKTEEVDILKQEALEEILEIEYEKKEKEFVNLLNLYPSYRNDERLKKEILNIYEFLVSIPFYNEWIEEVLNRLSETNEDYSKTYFGDILFKETKEILKANIMTLENQKAKLSTDNQLEIFKDTISEDIDILVKLYNISEWDKFYEELYSIKLKNWPTKKGLTSEVKDKANIVRGKVRKDIGKIKESYVREKTESILEDNLTTVSYIKTLFSLSAKFEKKYSEMKQDKNILDFADFENLALKLLIEKKDGKYIKTEIAKEISERYVEIQVDEYQDINKMQDLIIWAVSNNNVFRVGDLKQSIYKFRKANPDIFIEKYNLFVEKDDDNDIARDSEIGSKILLYQNFRSRKNVIDFCNDLFSKIMSKELGEIEYDEKEYLNYSANYEEKDITTEIVLVSKESSNREISLNENDLNSDDIEKEDEESEEEKDIELQETIEDIENISLEAYFIANRIKELIDSKLIIKDSSEYRNIEYRDIVILLRAASGRAEYIEKVLYEKGIPVYTDLSGNFLESQEIATIVSLLKIIDNPMLDIDFVSILRSYFGGFTLNEITKIRNTNKDISVYNSFLEFLEKTKDEKAKKFLDFYTKLKEVEKYLGITNLLNYILIESGYIKYISLENNGELKKANLKLFLNRAEEYESIGNVGLYKFIQYLEKLNISKTDISSANIIGEKENVVRIMTIHSSKGLEFPVVFLANANKSVNLQDLKTDLLLNLNHGVAYDYLDYEKKIRYPTLIKEALKIKMKEEIIAEEMRMLYVALTRAKEKLLITGTLKNSFKYLTDLKELGEMYTVHSKDKIKYSISEYILKAKPSYLEWILLAESLGLSNSEVKIVDAESLDFKEKEYKDEILKLDINDFKQETIDLVNEKLKVLDFEYKNQNINYTKVAASRVDVSKENALQENIKNIQMKKPNFMKIKSYSNAEIGSFNHLFLQKLNFNKVYSLDELENELNNIVKREILTKEQANLIDLKAILNFVKTEQYLEITKSRKEKEKQFIAKFLNSEIKEIIDKTKTEGLTIDKNDSEDTILIQGMIDLYYITEDNKLKILDYKTDNVDLESLKLRYTTQMLVYKKALEKALKRDVDQVLIYSTIHNKYIEI